MLIFQAQSDTLPSPYLRALRKGYVVRRIPRSFLNRIALAPSITILLLGITVWSGCATFARHRKQDAVVSAREIALRGVDALQSGQVDRANQLFAQAVEVCPVDERVRARYADVLWQQGRRKEAIQHMQEAVRLSGGDPQLLIRLGRMQLAAGNVNAAARLALQTVDSGRELAAAYRLQGDVLAAQGRWREALARYHRALAIHEDYPEVELAVGRLYYDHGEAHRALSTFQSLEDHYSKQEVPGQLLYLEGLAYVALNRFDPAIQYLTQATERGLNTAEVYYQLADAYYRSGDFANAALALQNSLQRDPMYSPARQLAQLVDPAGRIAARSGQIPSKR